MSRKITSSKIIFCQVPFEKEYIESVMQKTGQLNKKDAITFAVDFFMNSTEIKEMGSKKE